MPNSYRDQQLLMQSLGMLGDAMRKMKEEEQYNRILNELDPPRAGTADGRIPTEKPHRGGRIEYELWRQQQQMERQQQQDALTEELRRAQIARALREPQRTTVRRGEDDLTTYQRMQLELQRSREERLRQQGAARSAGSDDIGDVGRDLKATTGHTLAEWEAAKGTHRFVNEKGEPHEEGQLFEATIGGNPVRIGRSTYEAFLNRYKGVTPGAQAGAAVVRPQVAMTPPAPMPTKQDQGDDPEKVKQEYQAGRITREQARARLQALNFTQRP